MKKIIALALALVLSLSMATVAFAADLVFKTGDTGVWAPGEDFVLYASDFEDSSNNALLAAAGDLIGTADTAHDYFTSDYFTLSYKVAKGANLLESVKFADGVIKVTFKANYNLEQPAITNFAFDSIKVKARKDVDTNTKVTGLSRNTEYTAIAASIPSVAVGYVATVPTGATAHGTATDAISLDSPIKITTPGYFKFKAESNSSFRDATINLGDVYVSARIFDGEKFYFSVDNKADLDIIKANAETDAERIDFFKFKSNPTFSQRATVELPGEKGDFVYELKDGKLTKASAFKWNEEINAFEGKVLTLGNYVVSDVELKSAPAKDTDEDSKNPNTGANDFVGVAVALAVVSLVAAGAVSLKK